MSVEYHAMRCKADLDAVYEAGKLAVLQSSKYMRGTASGELVSLNDVSPVEHTVGVEVASKNLFDVGTVTFYEFKELVKRTDTPLPAGTYTFSATITESTDTNGTDSFFYYELVDGSANGQTLVRKTRTTRTFTVNSPIKYFAIYAGVNYAQSIGDTATYEDIQLERGATATAYTPYADTSAAKIQVLGKNWYNSTLSFGGLAGANGNIYETKARLVSDYIKAKPNTKYNISGIGDMVVGNRAAYDKDKKWLCMFDLSKGTPTDTAYLRIHFSKADNTQEFTEAELEAANALPIQLELGTTATEYEPYMFAEYSQGESVKSVHPTMNIMTDTVGASVDVEYLRDIDAYIDNLVGAAAVMTLEEV